eukprot:495171_1
MAENNQNEGNKKRMKKQPSKFGMMMNSVSRSAKKGMSRAGKQMAKGVVKAKQTAVEKIAKAPLSPEDPEIVSALERLKITKNEIYAISDIVRNLYEARVNEATFLIQLADKLNAVKISQNDPFGSYVQNMGTGLSKLENVQSEHLKRMEEELVIPLEKFRDVDVEQVQKLKLKYKSGKTQFDLSDHRLNKAQESQDQTKIQSAKEKRDAVYTELQALRNQMKFQVNNLEQKKQVSLLGCMEQYWSSYSSFAAAQSNILSTNTIEKEKYVVPPNNDDDEKNGYNDDNNETVDTPPAPMETNTNAMPPPPTYDNATNQNNENYNNGDYNEEYEQEQQYEEEHDNGPTDDYNPFGDDE